VISHPPRHAPSLARFAGSRSPRFDSNLAFQVRRVPSVAVVHPMRLMNRSPWLLVFLWAAGCGGQTTLQPASGPGIRFLCEGAPVANLHVRLHISPDEPFLAQGITTDDGIVRFNKLPQPPPELWYVALESVGDGGWMLDPQYATPGKSGLTVTTLDEAQPPTVELPKVAMRSLSR